VLGYFKQEGVIIRSGYDRISLRLNSEFAATDNLRIGLNVSPTISRNWQPAQSMDGRAHGGNLVGAFLAEYPTLPYQNPDGTVPFNTTYKGVTHPNKWYGVHHIDNDTESVRSLSNVFVEFEPIQGLVLKTAGNIQINNGEEEYWRPSDARLNPSFGTTSPLPNLAEYIISSSKSFSWLIENTATYTKSFGSHAITALGRLYNTKIQQQKTKYFCPGIS
jgi:hypothetical protein